MTELDKIQAKYDNFQRVVKESVPNQSALLLAFYSISLTDFLSTIYERGVKEGLSVKKIVNLIFSKINLTKKDFKEEQLDLLERYLEYFVSVAKVMYA